MNGFRDLQRQQSAGIFFMRPKRRAGSVIRREFAKLVAHHLLGNGHVMVDLAIVHLELEANKVGQDGGRSRLSPDRRSFLSWLGPHDREPMQAMSRQSGSGGWGSKQVAGGFAASAEVKSGGYSYGTICGPSFEEQLARERWTMVDSDSGACLVDMGSGGRSHYLSKPSA